MDDAFRAKLCQTIGDVLDIFEGEVSRVTLIKELCQAVEALMPLQSDASEYLSFDGQRLPTIAELTK